MKITEKALLRAIGNADEKMVAKAAPLHWNTESDEAIQKARVPKLSFRKITELVAVCAACCICIGTVLMVHRMHSNPAAPISDSASEQEARDVLDSFLSAFIEHNEKNQKRFSLADEMCKLLYNSEEIESGKAYADMDEIMQYLGWIQDYKIGEGSDWTAALRNYEQVEQDKLEMCYYHYYYDKNEPEQAKDFVNEYGDVLRFYRDCDKQYVFSVEVTLMEPGTVVEQMQTIKFGLYHYNGEWRVNPIPDDVLLHPLGLSKKQKEKLAAYREKYGPVELPLE